MGLLESLDAFSAGNIVEAVWKKGKPVAGFDPAGLRSDCCGAVIARVAYGRQTDLGWEIDHIKPASKGGPDNLENLQPLQWENNRRKSDTYPWTPELVLDDQE